MTDYALAHWINDQRKRKFTDDQIKQYCLKYGYDESVVEEAFQFLDTHRKEDLEMGLPPSTGGVKVGSHNYDPYALFTLVAIFVFPLAALPLGILSLKHIKKHPQLRGKIIATGGIIIGMIPILFLAFLLIQLLPLFA